MRIHYTSKKFGLVAAMAAAALLSACGGGGGSSVTGQGTLQVIVTAQQDGVVIKSTVPNATTGAFTLSPMTPSTTSSYVVVVTADGRTTAAISGVPVTVGTNTTVSTSTTPITLSASSMRTISGTVMPLAAQGSARATQTFAAGGPKVEVVFNAADLTTGAYSLSLPVTTPLLGKFGSGTLPITLTADSTIAGKYGLEASATGYATQTFNADVSNANATKDFVLVP